MQHISVDDSQNETAVDKEKLQNVKCAAKALDENSNESLAFLINYEAFKPLKRWKWNLQSWEEPVQANSENDENKKLDEEIKTDSKELSDEADDQVEKFDLKADKLLDQDALISSRCCETDLVKELWECKSRLDYWFDNGKEELYAEARKRVFPEVKKGPKSFYNRQGLKLKEIINNYSLIKRLLTNPKSIVVDILGSVHIWPECIFGCLRQLQSQGTTIPMNKIKVYGIINKRNSSFHKVTNDKRMPKHRPHFTPGEYVVVPNLAIEGDVVEPEHIDKIITYLKDQSASPAHLVLTDGSVLVGRDPSTNQHLENYHELYNSRCLLSQIVLSLHILTVDGDLVIKTFDMFSAFSISLLYILRQLFEVVQVEKPCLSRPVNSERYIVCMTLRQDELGLKDMLREIFYAWSSNSFFRDERYPATLVPDPIILNDSIFLASAKAMITRLCARQVQALNAVNAECDILQKEMSNKSAENSGLLPSIETSPDMSLRKDTLQTSDKSTSFTKTEQSPHSRIFMNELRPHFHNSRYNNQLRPKYPVQRRGRGQIRNPMAQMNGPSRSHIEASLDLLTQVLTEVGVSEIKIADTALDKFQVNENQYHSLEYAKHLSDRSMYSEPQHYTNHYRSHRPPRSYNKNNFNPMYRNQYYQDRTVINENRSSDISK